MRAVLFKGGYQLCNRGCLLADCHVNTDNAFALLVQNRICGYGGLACLTVADNQLPLASADGEHGVNRQDSRLHEAG